MSEEIICKQCGKKISEEDDDFSLCFICGEWFCNECIENLLPQNRCSACRTKRSEDAWIPYRLYSEDRDVDAKIQDERDSKANNRFR